MIANFAPKSKWRSLMAMLLISIIALFVLTGASTKNQVDKIKLEIGSDAVVKLNGENVHIDSLHNKLKEFKFADGSAASVLAAEDLTFFMWSKVHAILRSSSVKKIENVNRKTNRSITTLNYKDINSRYGHPDILNLKPTESDGKWGYADKTGNFIIGPIFDNAQYFEDGIAVVKLHNKFGCIDNKGKMVLKPEHQNIQNLHNGFAAFQKNNKWGVANKFGEIILGPKYNNIFSFTEGYALVRLNEKYGFINQAGELVIPLKFEKASLFWEGLAAVRVNNNWGYINKKGELEIPAKFEEAAMFQSGRAKVKVNNKYGFIDQTGVLVIPPQFSKAENFSEGLAAVVINGKYGFIDINGKVVIEPQYDFIGHGFQDGLSWVINFENPDLSKKGSGFFIDKAGNVLKNAISKN